MIGDTSSLKNARSILGGSGTTLQFTLVATAGEALSELASRSFDLLITDCSAEQKDLVQVIEKIREMETCEPLLMVTGPMKEGPGPDEFPETVIPAESHPGENARELFARLGSRISLALERTVPAEREKKHQARLCSILASIKTGVFIVDRRTRIILNANEYALRLLQLTKEDIVGSDFSTLLLLANSMAPVETLSEEAVFQSEGELRDTTGRTIPVIVNITPVKISTENDLLITFLDNSMPKITEKALAESETRFRILVDTSPDAIFLTDLEGTILKANNNARSLFGYSWEEDIRETALHDLIHRDDPRGVRHFLRDLITRGNIRKECTGYSGDGRPVPVEIDSSVIKNSDGIPFSLVHVIRDLTYPKQTEEALKESEERYRNVIEDQTEFICRFKPDGTHVFVNGAYCRYFGKTREEIVGSRFIPHIHPDDLSVLKDHFASLNPDHPVALIDHRIIMSDGEIKWQRWSDRALYGGDGTLIEYQSVGRDITERKEAEEALKASEERYRNVIEDQAEFICRFKPDGTHVFVNGAYCRYFGKTREEIIGSRFIPHVHPDDRAGLKEHFSSLTASHPVASFDHRIIMPDGEIRWQRWSDMALYGEDGTLIEYQSVGRDITRWKHESPGSLPEVVQ